MANALRGLFVDVLGLSTAVASGAGAVVIVLFVVMTGLQSSAIRAGIMALIGLFARGKGRTYDAFRALVLAGFLMILYDPKYLVYDVSFQLSFLATLGILFATPVLEQKFARVPKKFLYVIPLREAMSVTLGAQLGVLPFILYKMAFGTAAGLVGTVSIPLAYPASLITEGLLRYITALVTFFAKVPYASLVFKTFPVWLCLGMYAVLLWFVFGAWKDYSYKK